MINWKRIKELEDDIGAEEIGEVVEMFLDEVEAVIEPMRRGSAGRDVEADMHFLKGSALNLGFDTLGALCSEGEKKAACGKASDISVNAILQTYDQSKSEFLAYLPPG